MTVEARRFYEHQAPVIVLFGRGIVAPDSERVAAADCHLPIRRRLRLVQGGPSIWKLSLRPNLD
jgi:hypothetical protein